MSAIHFYLSTFLFLSIGFRALRLVQTIRKAHRQGRGMTSSRPIFWVMTAGYLIFLSTCGLEAFLELRPFSWGVSFAGLGLFLSALVLRERAMHDLGRFFSPDIEIRAQHHVVREGFYRFVRHPLLLCLMVEVLGLGLIFNAYFALISVGGGFYLPIVLLRKHLEEKVLLQSLGEEYRIYKREVGAFIPKPHVLFSLNRRSSHA
jgi:protein-S-isoprenylcysteine O-methyltransferase Ste14